MTPYEAIFHRKSIRKYDMNKEIPEEILQTIRNFVGDMLPIFPYIKTDWKVYRQSDFGKGTKGIFQVNAPYYVALYVQNLEGARFNAGNLMQQLSLYLHSKGIGSCFVGMMKPPVDDTVEEDMEFSIIMAIGYPKEELEREGKKSVRHPLSKLCVYKQEPVRAIEQLLESARLAPSSINGQPWKFIVYKNRIHIFYANKKKLFGLDQWIDIDMGIMMAHMLMTSEEHWMDTSFARIDNIAEKTIPNYQYFASVIMK